MVYGRRSLYFCDSWTSCLSLPCPNFPTVVCPSVLGRLLSLLLTSPRTYAPELPLFARSDHELCRKSWNAKQWKYSAEFRIDRAISKTPDRFSFVIYTYVHHWKFELDSPGMGHSQTMWPCIFAVSVFSSGSADTLSHGHTTLTTLPNFWLDLSGSLQTPSHSHNFGCRNVRLLVYAWYRWPNRQIVQLTVISANFSALILF